MPGEHSVYKARPIKVLHGIPRHYTYRLKLEAKWRRKGYSVRFG
jgi:hypothetical protein